MRDCEDKNMEELQKLPLEEKIKMSKMRLIEFTSHVNGKIYISFSGGKDSTVLLHLVRQVYPDTVAVFCDTGLEFPEIKDFVKTKENVITIRPKMNFKDVINHYGWPIISKEQSLYIGQCQRTHTPRLLEYRTKGRGPNGKSGKISNKWQYLLKAPFKIHNMCCDIMKKKPFKLFEKETGLSPIIGTMASESSLRRQQWERTGCNVFDEKRKSSRPLSFWTEDNIWEYIKKYDLNVADIYNKGAKRTGCVFCLYGYHMEKEGETRLDLLKTVHPKLYDYCMREDGLNMKEVLKWYPLKKEES